MFRTVNAKAELIGFMGRAIAQGHTENGVKMFTCVLLLEVPYTNDKGSKSMIDQSYTITALGKKADFLKRYHCPGKMMAVEGRLVLKPKGKDAKDGPFQAILYADDIIILSEQNDGIFGMHPDFIP